MATTLSLDNIHPLTDFQRNAKRHLQRLKKTKQPEVLTVNGRHEVVIKDAKSYQALLDQVEHSATVEKIRAAIKEADEGKGIPADRAFQHIRSKLSGRKKVA